MRMERALVAALLLAWSVNCGEEAAPGDAAEPRADSGARADAGSRRDASAGDEPDDEADEQPEAMAARDSGRPNPADASRPIDAGAVADAGAPTDAAARADAAGAGAFTLMSPVYKDGQAIPSTSRCESPSPSLSWSAGPSGTLSYAITLRDVTPGFSMGFTHWLIYDIPASRLELPMGVPQGAAPASLAPIKQGPNYAGGRVYQGPCGLAGVNRYELTLYALDVETLPELTASSSSAQVTAAIEAHDLARSKVTVTSSPN